jgi:hypothetical protein
MAKPCDPTLGRRVAARIARGVRIVRTIGYAAFSATGWC